MTQAAVVSQLTELDAKLTSAKKDLEARIYSGRVFSCRIIGDESTRFNEIQRDSKLSIAPVGLSCQ